MDANQIVGIINQPIDVLVVLAAGYIGYKVAYTGKNKQHKPVDVVFISLAFGLVAQIVYGPVSVTMPAVMSIGAKQIAAVIAVFVALVVASLWRKFLEGWVKTLLRASDVSFSDGCLTVLDTIRVSTKHRLSQLTVRMIDGSAVMCDYLYLFEDKPFGPCQIGEDGSVALYVNCFRRNNLEDWQDIDPVNEIYGSSMTYIPANQIKDIELRYLP